MLLEQNIKGLCERNGISFQDLLSDMEVDNVFELTLYDLEALCEEYHVDLQALLFKPLYRNPEWITKLDRIKLLVLDVDGVMTDGGMYFSESGEQSKKFNTKDGMGILHLTKNNFQVAIISSGFKGEAVKLRAEMLGIQHYSVNREPKMNRLLELCNKLKFNLDQVAVLGDDVNDLEMMEKVGLAVCPKDAVPLIKSHAHIILNQIGGAGCIREFIDEYLLNEPLSN